MPDEDDFKQEQWRADQAESNLEDAKSEIMTLTDEVKKVDVFA